MSSFTFYRTLVCRGLNTVILESSSLKETRLSALRYAVYIQERITPLPQWMITALYGLLSVPSEECTLLSGDESLLIELSQLLASASSYGSDFKEAGRRLNSLLPLFLRSSCNHGFHAYALLTVKLITDLSKSADCDVELFSTAALVPCLENLRSANVEVLRAAFHSSANRVATLPDSIRVNSKQLSRAVSAFFESLECDEHSSGYIMNGVQHLMYADMLRILASLRDPVRDTIVLHTSKHAVGDVPGISPVYELYSTTVVLNILGSMGLSPCQAKLSKYIVLIECCFQWEGEFSPDDLDMYQVYLVSMLRTCREHERASLLKLLRRKVDSSALSCRSINLLLFTVRALFEYSTEVALKALVKLDELIMFMSTRVLRRDPSLKRQF